MLCAVVLLFACQLSLSSSWSATLTVHALNNERLSVQAVAVWLSCTPPPPVPQPNRALLGKGTAGWSKKQSHGCPSNQISPISEDVTVSISLDDVEPLLVNPLWHANGNFSAENQMCVSVCVCAYIGWGRFWCVWQRGHAAECYPGIYHDAL